MGSARAADERDALAGRAGSGMARDRAEVRQGGCGHLAVIPSPDRWLSRRAGTASLAIRPAVSLAVAAPARRDRDAIRRRDDHQAAYSKAGASEQDFLVCHGRASRKAELVLAGRSYSYFLQKA